MKCEARMFLGPLRPEKVHCGSHVQRASLVGHMEPWDESQAAWGWAAAKTPGEQLSISAGHDVVPCSSLGSPPRLRALTATSWHLATPGSHISPGWALSPLILLPC